MRLQLPSFVIGERYASAGRSSALDSTTRTLDLTLWAGIAKGSDTKVQDVGETAGNYSNRVLRMHYLDPL